MADNVDFYSLPMGADPDNDPLTGGQDELGNPLRRTFLGTVYSLQRQPVSRDFESEPGSMERVKEIGSGIVEGAIEGTKAALSAPRRAMEGEDVTYGDVAGTAGFATTGAIGVTKPEGSLSSGAARSKKEQRQVPTFKLKGQQAGRPDPKFGTKEIKDIFEEDRQDLLSVQEFDSQLFDEENWSLNLGNEYDVERLGYARRIPLHELAEIKLGNKNVEDVINYYGTDPNPDTISYINSRIARLDNDPEFNDYVTKLRDNPDFDPNVALYEGFAPAGLTAEFRSPIAETVSELNYPAKGIEGYQLISALQKNPSIRKAELDTVLDDIDPKARYSREEIENIVADNSWITTARVLDDESPEWTKFGSYQRQRDLLDPEAAYFEVLIDSKMANPEKGQFSPRSQHFNEETLAHSRASIRSDEVRGDDYLLVEELQSDLLQQGFDEPVKGSKPVSPREAVQQSEAALEDWGLTSEADRLMLQMIGEDRNYASYFDAGTVDQFINEVGPEQLLAKPGATVEDVKKATGYYEGDSIDNLLSLYSNYRVGYPGRVGPVNNDAWDIFDSIKDFYWNNVSDKIKRVEEKPISAPPIKKIEESVKLTLNTLIAEADKRGVDRIVIPPFERIVEKRFDFGSSSYKKALDKSSGFYKTYVKSVNKAIKELEDEFGRENISSRLIDMNYSRNNIGSISDALEDRLGFTPDNGWEDYLRNDFYDDLYAFNNSADYDSQVPSGLTAGEVGFIQRIAEGSTGLRSYQFREYLEGTDPDFGKFLKGRIPDLPVTGTEIDIKGLRQAGYDLSRPRFAEGGLAMARQMKMFEEGGLSDDGMDRDPVTGNEIPPGSTAKNVRDDIPAQLSEGEYIVPADVVKYFGVKFFEDLRTRAKQGLREMDEDGRIGGEPMMPAGMGGEGLPDDMAGSIEDIDPRMLANLSEDEIRQLENIETMIPPRPRVQKVSEEDKAALAQMTGMAMGGMVAPVDEDALIDRVIQAAKNNPTLSQKLKSRGVMMAEGGMVSQPGMMVDPYQQQKTMYSTGMAVGGLSSLNLSSIPTATTQDTTTPTTSTTPTFDPSQYSAVGGSYFGSGTGPVSIVEYIGPNGEILPVRTQSGRPIDPVPVGFKTKEQKAAEASQATSVVAPTVIQPRVGFNADTAGDPQAPESDPYSGVDFNDPVGAAQAAAQSVTDPGFLGSVLSGGVLGTVSQLGNRSVAAANHMAAIDKYGEDSEEAQKAKEALDAIDDKLNPMAKSLKSLATGKNRYSSAQKAYNAYLDSPQQSKAREVEKSLGLGRGEAIAMGQGLAGKGGGADTFGEDFAAASAHAAANPTGMTAGTGLTPDDVIGNLPGDVTGGRSGSSGNTSGSTSGGSTSGGSDSEGMAGVRYRGGLVGRPPRKDKKKNK